MDGTQLKSGNSFLVHIFVLHILKVLSSNIFSRYRGEFQRLEFSSCRVMQVLKIGLGFVYRDPFLCTMLLLRVSLQLEQDMMYCLVY